jgi:hypothetical protein
MKSSVSFEIEKHTPDSIEDGFWLPCFTVYDLSEALSSIKDWRAMHPETKFRLLVVTAVVLDSG